MSKTVEIGYVSMTDMEYSDALRKVKTLAELRKHCNYYSPIAQDAVELANKMTPADFERFLDDLKVVSRVRGKRAQRIADEWGDILMPKTMLTVGMVAMQFTVPFGTAYIRMKEMGKI